MKKRIISLFLVLATVICAVPALSLVSFAAEPVEKNYDYYKDLWYDDGHLVSFVDINATVDSYAANTEAGANEDANILYGSIGSKPVSGNSTGTRTFVKIIGGKEAGNYYILNTKHNNYINGGAFSGYANGATNLYELVRNVNQSEYAVHLGEAFTYAEATAKGTGASDEDGSLDTLYKTVGNTITVESITSYDDDAFNALVLNGAGGNYNRFVRSVNFALKSNSYYVYRPAIDGNTGTNQGKAEVMIEHNRVNTKTPLTFDGLASKNSTVHTAVSYTLVSYADGNLSYSVKNTVYDNGVSYTAESAENTVYATAFANRVGTDNTVVMATAHSQGSMVYLRVYDCALTEEQLAQNHFADLCYYYKLDIEPLETYKALGKIDGDFYNIFSKMNVNKCDAQTVEMMQKYINDPDYDPAMDSDYVLDAKTAKYIDLYYDDGHLMALIDMSNISENETVYLDGATVPVGTTSEVIAADGEVPETARLVIGQKNAAFGANGVQTHSYIRVAGGKYAGKYFMLGSFASSPQIERTSDGFVFPYTQLMQFSAGDSGIYYSYAFNRSQLTTKFSGLDKQGDLTGALLMTSFVQPSPEIMYTGNYGAFTVEEVMYGNAYYDWGKQHYLDTHADASVVPGYFSHMIYFGGQSLGCMRYPTGNINLTDLGTGYIISRGGSISVKIQSNSSFHAVYTTRFIESGVFTNSFFVLDSGKVTKVTGGAYNYDFVNELHKNRIVLDGSKMYYSRIYDTVLTEAQMMQNHFADLCYFYELDNVDKLVLYKDVLMNEAFYGQFSSYEIGDCVSTDISAMQEKIDTAVAKIANVDKATALALLESAYSSVCNAKGATASALASVNDLIATVEGYIDDISEIVAENEVATRIINEKTALIEAVVESLNSVRGDVAMLDIKAGRLLEESEAVYSGIQDSSSVDSIMAAYNAIRDIAVSIGAYSDSASFIADNSVAIKDGAGADVKYAMSANAIATTDPTNYIKYVGMQARIYDFAAMRAIFSVSDSALAQGYTYGDKSYEIVATGMLYGIADGGIDSLTVSYQNGSLVAADGVTVRGFEDRYRALGRADAAAKANGFADGYAYAIETSFATVGASQMKTALLQEYAYRAFIVFEGEGTSYVVYVDAVGEALGDSVSAYELAKAVAASADTDPAWLAETNYISKAIKYVESADEE
ncbi:MAG: hypothetical protein IKA74_00570 [Clostridia bacterium]|nr:hypothetical protein [Clostridia bacterium]